MGNMCGGGEAEKPTAQAAPHLNKNISMARETRPLPPPAPKAEEPAKAEVPASAAPVAVAEAPPAVAAVEQEKAPAAEAAGAEIEAPAAKKVKIFVIYYSTYGHIGKMADTYKAALMEVEGVEVELYQVAETLSADVLAKMHAPPKPDVPILDPNDLPKADALVFGFPTRFGMMASQMKSFFDATGSLWQSGALVGKPASMFTSTAGQGGGQETTLMTAVTQLTHHGMLYVPTGYAAGEVMFGVETAKGGSPWGAGTLAAADGSRQPSEVELQAVKVQAKLFGGVAKKLAA